MVTHRIRHAPVRSALRRTVQDVARQASRTAHCSDQRAHSAQRHFDHSAGFRPCTRGEFGLARPFAHAGGDGRVSDVLLVPPRNAPLARKGDVASGTQALACLPPCTWWRPLLRRDVEHLGPRVRDRTGPGATMTVSKALIAQTPALAHRTWRPIPRYRGIPTSN